MCGREDCGGGTCVHTKMVIIGMILVSGRSEVGLVDARRDLYLRGRRRPVGDRRDGAPRGDVPRLGVAVDRLHRSVHLALLAAGTVSLQRVHGTYMEVSLSLNRIFFQHCPSMSSSLPPIEGRGRGGEGER